MSAYVLPDDTDAPRLTRAVQWLIAINVAIYFLQLTVVGSQNMELALGFQARDLGRSWWSVVTYMFVHANAWHLVGNMYVLYLFGPRIEHKWSAGEFTRFYILCGLGGWFAHLLFARGSLIVGASAAVYGVALAYARQWPDDEIQLFGVIPIKVKWLVALYIASDIVGGLADRGATGLSGGTAHLAHLGGLAAGWLYLRTSSVTTIERLRQRVSPVADISDEPPRAIPRSMPRNRDGGNVREKAGEVDDIVAKSKAATARRPSVIQVPKAPSHKRAADLDMVLDKISEQGLDSLTLEERMLLEEASKKLRSDR